MKLNKLYKMKDKNKLSDITISKPFDNSYINDNSGKKSGDSMSDNGFKKNSDYYITLTELFSSIRDLPEKYNPNKSFVIKSEFIRIKKGKHPIPEIHSGVKVRYLACVVYHGIEFPRLDIRKIDRDVWDVNHTVYFIPISIIYPSISIINSRDEIMALRDLINLNIFQYTGSIESFRTESIFTLSKAVYLTNKPDIDDCKIKVII